jgi:hypothetical protein
MFRIHTPAAAALLCAVACTTGSPPTRPSGDAGLDRPAAPNEPSAATLGMTVLSRDASGAPRLMQSIVPRARATGMTLQAAARDHIAALAPLWVGRATPMALADAGTQQLRNGATVTRLRQEVDGAVVHQGELRVLMHPDGSLAAVSGTLLGKDASDLSDTQLVSPVLVASTTAPFVVTLAHAYNIDGFDSFLFDGAVIEVSTDGGTTWIDVSQLGVDPGYTGRVITTENVLFDRQAFGGQSPGFPAPAAGPELRNAARRPVRAAAVPYRHRLVRGLYRLEHRRYRGQRDRQHAVPGAGAGAIGLHADVGRARRRRRDRPPRGAGHEPGAPGCRVRRVRRPVVPSTRPASPASSTAASRRAAIDDATDLRGSSPR